ncbi:MAG: hypothetical protein IPJ12_11645 [Betaproteobacteria bacterium]|nr:hypothetical protein [Betaproteobacteria bacterium]
MTTVQPRLILIHKQSTSGRLRFLCLSSGVVAFTPLPALSALHEEAYSPKIQFHPTASVREAEVQLGLPEGAIEPVADFQAWVDTPAGDVPVLLAAFVGIDPPFEAAERTRSRFIAITESRQLSEVERNLLRRAYEHVLG